VPPATISLDGLLDRLRDQELRQRSIREPSYGEPGLPSLRGPVSCESRHTPGFAAKTEEPCSDCLARDALDIFGRPRRLPDSGMRLTSGCQECGGSGKVPVRHPRRDGTVELVGSRPKGMPVSLWNLVNDPYSRK